MSCVGSVGVGGLHKASIGIYTGTSYVTLRTIYLATEDYIAEQKHSGTHIIITV